MKNLDEVVIDFSLKIRPGCYRHVQNVWYFFCYSFVVLVRLFVLCYTLGMPYIPPVYPTTIPTILDLPDRSDDVDWVIADRYNELKKELRAALIELGTLPKAGYADVKARLDAIEAAVTPIPSGCIVIWTGTLANIPAGWSLCDGVGGRPNLLDRFVVGVPDAVTDPGGTGGAATHSHTVNSHTHPGGSHIHSQSGAYDDSGLGGGDLVAGGTGYNTGSGSGVTGGATPGTDSKSNKPPYYVVAYIIKD